MRSHAERSCLLLLSFLFFSWGCQSQAVPDPEADASQTATESEPSQESGMVEPISTGDEESPAENEATSDTTDGNDTEAASQQAANQMKDIAIGLHKFANDNRYRFPAAHNNDENGTPLLSWRVHLLPYLDQADLYAEFHLNESWDSDHNKPLVEKIPAIYRAPETESPAGHTNYVSIWIDGGVIVPQPDLPPLEAKGNIGIPHVVDGTTRTIMFVEVADDDSVPWTKPADFSPTESLPALGIGGMRAGKFMAAFCDAHIESLGTDIDTESLTDLILRNNGRPE